MDVAAVLVALLTLAAGRWPSACSCARSRAAAVSGRALRRPRVRPCRSRRGTRSQATSTAHGPGGTCPGPCHARGRARGRPPARRGRAAPGRAQAQAEARLREAFARWPATRSSRNNEAFAELAAAKLGAAKAGADGDLAQRQQAIEGMVAPLRESLERVQHQLTTVESERTGSYATLLEQIATMRQTSEQLRVETTQLVTALRAPQVRGRWGEMQLERAVEAAGMTEHLDYVTQVTACTAGRDRPPGPRGAPRRRQERRRRLEGRLQRLPRGDGGHGRADPRRAAEGARPAPARSHRRAGGEGLLGALLARRRSSWSASCRPTRSSMPRCGRIRRCSSGRSSRTSSSRHRPRSSRCCARSPTPGGRRRLPPTPPRCTGSAASCTSGSPRWAGTSTSWGAR